MALLDDLKEGTHRDGVNLHKPVKGKYYILGDVENGRILQIDTYGSEDRAIPGKQSQSIQFSPEVIDQLKKILKDHF